MAKKTKTASKPRTASTAPKSSKARTPARKPAARNGKSTSAKAAPAAATTREQIAMAAYYRAESRGFVPGHELEDWLWAEASLR